MNILPPIKNISEVDYAKRIATLLMLKAYYFDIPQTLLFGDREVTFTKENTAHLIQPLMPSKSKSSGIEIQSNSPIPKN